MGCSALYGTTTLFPSVHAACCSAKEALSLSVWVRRRRRLLLLVVVVLLVVPFMVIVVVVMLETSSSGPVLLLVSPLAGGGGTSVVVVVVVVGTMVDDDDGSLLVVVSELLGTSVDVVTALLGAGDSDAVLLVALKKVGAGDRDNELLVSGTVVRLLVSSSGATVVLVALVSLVDTKVGLVVGVAVSNAKSPPKMER
jgi:hypothetical protein